MVGSTKGKLITVLLIAFFFVECANQLPPGGGDIDKTSPTIIEVFPEDGTTHFTEDYFEIGFSEYVEKRSVKEAIFISPAIEGELELNWSGKYVRVYFPDALKQDVTYVITIGTDVEDFNNNNNMLDAFTFTFSTGEKIDRRMITGKVISESMQGVMLFGYKIQSTDDSLLNRKPDYISQSNSNGKYKLAGLAEGTYRVFAVRDEFRDLLYQLDQDEIGIPFADITLRNEDTLYTGLDFILTKMDTIKPRILSAVMTDRHHILVNFSEELNKSSIKPINFYLIDSTANKRVQVRYAYKGNTKASEIVLIPSEVFDPQNSMFLFADTLLDKSSNSFAGDFAEVTLSDKADTSITELYEVTPQSGTKDVDYLQPKFVFKFNDAFEAVTVREGIAFSDTSNKKIPFDLHLVDDASFVISPSKALEKSKDYIIKFNMSKFKDFAGNFADTIYQYTFKTITGLEFTGVKGSLLEFDHNKNPMIELKNIEKDELIYSALLINGQFNFERVLPGKYLLFAYYDTDSSNTHSKGNIFPFQKSEEFSVHPDTLNLRARWIETDVKFFFSPKP